MPYEEIEQNKNAYNSAYQAVQSGIPQGLTASDLNNMKSQVSAGTMAGATNALANMRGQLGGSANPLYAAMSGRLQAGAQAGAAAQIADIDRQDVQRRQDLENIRRSQMIDLSGIGAQYAGIAANLRNIIEQSKLGWAAHNLNVSELDWKKQAGMMDFGLRERDLNRVQTNDDRGYELQQDYFEYQKKNDLRNYNLSVSDLMQRGQLGWAQVFNNATNNWAM